ncbi:hypothetical protein HQ531_12320 [bacterium]|nr:hypothetical protein [bacterium]
MKSDKIQAYLRASNWVLIIYLSVMISGCAMRPDEISPEAARILQTREFSGTPEEVAKAAIVVLQEMHYTLGNFDMGIGIITAERTSERLLAPISREAEGEPELADEIGTFCLIAGTMAVIGIFLAWIFGDSEDDDDDDYDRNRNRGSHSRNNHPSPIFFNSDDSGPESYKYNMTITLEEITPMQTQVRVTVQGEHLEGSGVSETGPVQSQEFYTEFFNRLNQVLNN